MDCIQYEEMSGDCEDYVNKILDKYSGCSERFTINRACFAFFNHLGVYFPEAYKHMIEQLELQNEDS